MHDALVVGVVQGFGGLDEPLCDRAVSGLHRRAAGVGVGRGQARGRTPGGCGGGLRPQFLDDLFQGHAVDQVHRVEVQPALAADGEDRHDVRVMQLGGRQRLVLEAGQRRSSSIEANGKTFSATRRSSEICSAS